jgi:hypothetical protein
MAEWGRIVSLRNASERLLADPKADLGHSLSQRPILAEGSRCSQTHSNDRFGSNADLPSTLAKRPLLSGKQTFIVSGCQDRS